MIKPVNFFTRNIKYQLVLLMVIFAFCSAKSFIHQENKGNIKNVYLADPNVFYTEGIYYLYGTGGSQYNDGFAVYTSTDLKTWTGPVGVKEGYALKKGDAYGETKFWAPQVFKYRNKFYMAYAANEHIAIAVSNSPLGPFIQDVSKPLSEEVKQIDPYVFIDDDGKNYLYYVVVANGGNRIFVAEMTGDLLAVQKGTSKQCIEATMEWENRDNDTWSVTEGPTVLKHKGLYYLIYSANHFKSVDYAVGYAVSKSPDGPWRKYEGNPILHKSITGQNGSGHGDIVKGKNNEWFYAFHTHNSADKISPRKTAGIKLKFTKDKKSGPDKLAIEPGSFDYFQQK